MYAKDDDSSDGSMLNATMNNATPSVANSDNKSWRATPLSPSITEEVSYFSNHASTINDELYAWLLHNKVDDERIGNYLCSREITLGELELFTDEELQELAKNIEKVNKTTIQMIDKNRFIRACKSLRPQMRQQQSNSLSHPLSQQSHLQGLHVYI